MKVARDSTQVWATLRPAATDSTPKDTAYTPVASPMLSASRVTLSSRTGATVASAPVTPRLSDLTTLRLGGPPRALVEATDEAALVAAVREAEPPVLVLAGGSNLVVADAGFDGTVVARAHARHRARRRRALTVAAGEPWDDLVAYCVAHGLAGVECLTGIPGSTGATPIQNVGAYGQEVAQTITSVRVLDRETDAVRRPRAASECGFGYRASRFKYRDRWVVLSVTFDAARVAS